MKSNIFHFRFSIVLLLSVITLFSYSSSENDYNIKVYFIYGSKPGKGYKKTESKYFGGIHGGHVKVQTENFVAGFNPNGRLHIFSHKKEIHGMWCEEFLGYDSVKMTVFTIPVSKQTHDSAEMIIKKYLLASPYDYAFFGMRCASAAYDLMSQVGIFKKRSKCGMIWVYFYPKLVRNLLFKSAKDKNITIEHFKGKVSRKWESDKTKYLPQLE
ncbi:MAG: hypothetical protein A2W91_04160 [Bacteroidetes bacterium GWF2_38_335]|nr:MAG: hypothetical protein A2W91_04160 [Bacteroidetes bacterium GWF2_38_335]OFY79145.1 MAG: hypothetical protein A2281_03495 [Bacteroidetes bacterium RIFOXYA12_FULL_38_20]HBS88768.1 hypothetical protein [Bacteroidales bacterium]